MFLNRFYGNDMVNAAELKMYVKSRQAKFRNICVEFSCDIWWKYSVICKYFGTVAAKSTAPNGGSQTRM